MGLRVRNKLLQLFNPVEGVTDQGADSWEGTTQGRGDWRGGGGAGLFFPCDSGKGIFCLEELEGESWLQFYNRKQEK